MKGLKVQCPNCKRKSFETTDRFDPNATPNGSMVKCLLPYAIDWLMTSTTLSAEMTCPECLCQLAPSGALNVIIEPRRIGEFFKTPLNSFAQGEDKIRIPTEEVPELPAVETPKVGKPAFICEICGKELSSPLALAGHKRSHKEK